MYPKHLNQTNRTMNVTIEHVFCRYSDEAEEIYFRIMNTILFAIQSPNQKIPDRKTKCVIKTHINIKQNVIFGAKLKPV